ncbi:MAG: strawberry notch family protein [Candidatus Babeliaceae bacterium]|jgi:hypothetical protein
MKKKLDQYVKIVSHNTKCWLYVAIDRKTNMPIRTESGLQIGTDLKTFKAIPFHPSDVIAFYEGSLDDVTGLGMPYIPTADVCTVLDTIVPDSMGYETHIAVRIVQEIVGKHLNEWVAEKLHYTELELCKSLSAEQVDAVALGIYNIEYKKQGMIIGDQTGIGKGRVAAAMIRYGFYNGYKPIFLSEKPNLFTDIYRDLVDIGSKTLIPFIINGKEAKTDIKDEDGNVVHQALPKTEQDKIFKSKKFPSGYDFACGTYTQFNSPTEKFVKPDFLNAIAKDNLLIMDEAHNASGSSNTGEFLQSVLVDCKGVIFLSATFAKRPDNMPVYALKTSISEANMTNDELVEAIIKGGVALQEVLAAQLVSEGQMLRRERSFEGVEVNYITLTEKETEHKAVFDTITEILRDIINFQTEYVTKNVENMDKIAAAEGKKIEERKGTSKAGVDNTPYFSKVFMVVNQILFSLKARSVAELAIQRLSEGKKPIIAFSSTMESFFDDMQNEAGQQVTPGDTVNLDFKGVLQKGLKGVMKYTEIDLMGNRVQKYFELSELAPEAQEMYHSIVKKINTVSTGISVSPIDVIKDIIRKAGYTCDEVTGRKNEIQIIENSNNGVLMSRKKLLANDAFRMYNNNELDVLMINQSGSTGASAHAIVTPKVKREDVKQRVMIILQPELDINREVQKRGRINRTGQIMKPIYDYVSSCIPAENRLMMMLRKKLKSLDANTTSSSKTSDNILNVDDFLNKYGDKIVLEYLKEYPEFNKAIDDPLSIGNEEKETASENAASKVSGRVAVLSTEQQEKFYNDILERYNDYVSYLKQSDQYDLEVQELNLQAETIDTQTLIEGKAGKSVFSENTLLEKCQVNVLKKPFTTEEIRNILNENLQNRDGKEIQSETINQAKTFYANKLAIDIEKLQKKYDKLIEDIPNEKGYAKTDQPELYLRERTQILNDARTDAIHKENEVSENKFYNIHNILNFYYPGKALNIPTIMQNMTVKGICMGYNIDKKKDNPFAPSAIKIKIAIASTDKYIDLTLSGDPGKKLMEIMGYSNAITRSEQDDVINNWEYYTKNSSGSRRQAYIITGNILQAFASYTGKLISYTTMDGSIKKGILLPENYDPAKQGRKLISVPIIKALNYIKQMNQGIFIYSTDDKISIEKFRDSGENNYRMFVPANKAYQDVFKDDKIIKICNNPRDGFEKRGNQMIAYFENEKISKLVDHLQEKHKLSVSMSPSVYDQFIDKKTVNKTQNQKLIDSAEAQYKIDKSNFEDRKNIAVPVEKVKAATTTNIALLKLKLKMKAKVLELMDMSEALTGAGKCAQTGCVVYRKGFWRVKSNITGKLWNAKYKTPELAKAAIAAYHVKKKNK